ncbi:hypothetical protein [Paraburkholderia phenoliruptrix]|uniref:hypothetical protein n=1 Tax=Paraburkholderia phenoliruptrix TaxID=252970 RepID=UPI0039B60271
MSNQLTNTEKLSVAVASAVLAAAALALGLRMTLAPTYSDFIVGRITWQAETKFQDLFTPPLVIAVLFIGLIVFSSQMKRLKDGSAGWAQDLSEQLLWWSVPSVVVAAGLVTGSSADRVMQLVSAAAVIVLVAHTWLQGGRTVQHSPAVVGLGLFAAFIVALLPLELALAVGRAPVSIVGLMRVERYAQVSHVVIAVLFVAVLVSAVNGRWLVRFLPGALLIGQLGLPFFYLTLYPARLALPDGSLTKYSTTWWLKALVVALLIAGVADVIRCYRNYRRGDRASFKALISPLALFGLLVAFKFGNTIGPALSTNDYEFGQNLLGWWSYVKGVVPYVGYIAPHGFMEDDLPGLLSLLFYDGTAASIADANRLGSTLLSLITFLALFRFSGSLSLAFVATFFIGGRSAFLFFTPFLCLWFSASLRATPARWLAVWLVTAPIVVLGVPPAGVLLVAASGLLALEALWRVGRGRERAGLKVLAAVCVTLVMLAIATPFVPMLFGAIRYVLENGPINQVAYGIPWDASWNTNGPKSGLVFEAVRMSWIVAPFFCLMLAYVIVRRREANSPALLPTVVVLLFTLLLTPYSMGRIDAGDLSRAGLAAIFGWAVLIPIVAWHAIQPRHRVALVIAVAGASATLNYTSLAFSTAVTAAAPSIAIGPMKNGADVGMPNIGRAMVQDEQWANLIKLNTLLNSVLPPGEGYLDVTSRNARTFYMNRPVTMAVTAPYNMALVRQQERAVERLSERLPDIALIGAGNLAYDGGGLALRDPVLYRFVVDHYTPVWADGVILGYSSKRAATADLGQRVTVVAKNLTDDRWERGVSRNEAALLLDSEMPMSAFAVGAQLRLADGQQRRVTKFSAEQHTVWLDGGPLDRSKVGYPAANELALNASSAGEFRMDMLDAAFSAPDLGEIPVAWGRSNRSLAKKMFTVAALDSSASQLRDLVAQEGQYKVAGGNPQISYDVTSLKLSGHAAGILRFDFACFDRRAEPRLTVSWSGAQQAGPSAAGQLHFTADDGVLIVPIDAYPRWLILQRVAGLQIGLANPGACGAVRLKNVTLLQRNVFQ